MKYSLPTIGLFLAVFSGSSFASEGQISQDLLAEMGLAGMTVVSEEDAMQVRGQGFVLAYSTSVSQLPGTYDESHAFAEGHRYASARSGSMSSAEIDILVLGHIPRIVAPVYEPPNRELNGGLELPLLFLHANVKVGSYGYARARAR